MRCEEVAHYLPEVAGVDFQVLVLKLGKGVIGDVVGDENALAFLEKLVVVASFELGVGLDGQYPAADKKPRIRAEGRACDAAGTGRWFEHLILGGAVSYTRLALPPKREVWGQGGFPCLQKK